MELGFAHLRNIGGIHIVKIWEGIIDTSVKSEGTLLYSSSCQVRVA